MLRQRPSFMLQQRLLSALLGRVIPPLFPFISIISHLLPSFSLAFLSASSSLSLVPSRWAGSLSHLHLLLFTYISSPPCWRRSHGPGRVFVGFQMVWLAEGSELTPSAADPVLPQTPGGFGSEHVSQARREADDKRSDQRLRANSRSSL